VLPLLLVASLAPSVYRLEPLVDVPVSALAGATILLPYASNYPLTGERCPCAHDVAHINVLDAWAVGNESVAAARASDITVALVLLVPPIADAFDVGASEALLEDLSVFGETLLVNGALVTVTKYVVQRPLPRTYAGDPELVNSSGGYRSFYSGHTSLTFAALTAASMTVRLRHGDRLWTWMVTAVVGTSVAAERVADGRHFPTDVLAGAVMGTAVGLAVPWLHARVDPSAPLIGLAPARDGAMLTWSARF
jgi:membrane-associated phospholipid phosphatase